MIFLTSCTRTVYVKPESALTVDMIKPEIEGETWRDVAEMCIKRGQTIDEGNRRFKAIRGD